MGFRVPAVKPPWISLWERQENDKLKFELQQRYRAVQGNTDCWCTRCAAEGGIAAMKFEAMANHCRLRFGKDFVDFEKWA